MADWAGHIRQRLGALRLDPAREAEIVEELSQHLDQKYEALRRDGLSPEAAEGAAMQELLGPEALASYMRPLRQAHVPAPIQIGSPRRSLRRDFLQDLRYALGMLRRQPGFAAAAILTLALGIGANSAIFALVDAALLRPLPLPAPDRLLIASERIAESSRERISPNDLLDWRARSRSLEAIAGFVPGVGGMVMAGRDGQAETVSRQWVTAGFFDVLGAPPVAGRYLQVADDRARMHAVVLSESFWRTRFDADPNMLGREIRLDGSLFTIVGIAPDVDRLLGKTDIWAMTNIEGAPPRARSAHMLRVVARLRPGVTLASATSDLSVIADALARDYPKTNAGRGVSVESLDAFIIGADLRQTALLFVGVVLFVLLICCANVANLLLVRGAARSRELAIRAAIGADRPRLIRQLLTESLMLSLLGGLLGLALAAAILRVVPSIIPDRMLPPALVLTVDLRVVLFCFGATFLVGLLFGLTPAWRTTSIPLGQALAIDGRTVAGGGDRLRNLFVAAEVATAVLLLVGAGLLLRTLLAVETIDRGYRAESVLTMMVDPLGSRYPTDEKLMQFYDAVEQEVRALPGVRSTAWSSTLPLGSSEMGNWLVTIVGDPPPDPGNTPTADYQIVSPSYFQTLDLAIISGRAFDARDARAAVPVCIVNEAFARAHASGRSPIGLRVSLREDINSKPEEREIVGVARQIKGRPDEIEDFQQVYVPLAQTALDDMYLVVRPSTGRAGLLASSVRAAIGRVDREQLVSVRDILTLEDVAWDATARQRFRAMLMTSLAALALVLAMVGLFGTLAYAVQRQMRDLAVRRALGATTWDVIRLVANGAAIVLLPGMIIGVTLAAALGRLLATMLFGVTPFDPVTFALVIIVVNLTALIALAVPTWRATRVDPVVALRGD